MIVFKAPSVLPNLVTASRIVAAITLIVFGPFSMAWYALYFWCGVSDMLDGWLARHQGVETSFGARLDSLADALFVLAVAIGCIPLLAWETWMVVWMVAIALVRVASLIVCRVRFGCYTLLHTWANKATGAVLFVAVAAVFWVGLPVVVLLSCVVATLSSVEELFLMVRMPL